MKWLLLVLALLWPAVGLAGFADDFVGNGRGDFKAALRGWKLLAEQPDALVRFNLGVWYHNGESVPQDGGRGYALSSLAAAESNEQAAPNHSTSFDSNTTAPARLDRLRLKPAHETWVEVYDRDGRRLYFNLAKAGSEIELTGKSPFRLLFGYAEDTSVWFNGVHFDPTPFAIRGVARFMLSGPTNPSGPQELAASAPPLRAPGMKTQAAELQSAADRGVANLATGVAAYSQGAFKTALREFRKLAEQGNAKAQVMLGVMYQKGDGVPQNYREAVQWFRRSAEQGYVDAQHLLGVIYRDGELGIPQDDAAAAKWFRLAADQGDADAQGILGGMYALGRGVPKDYIQAHKWLNLAAASGNEPARKARDALASKLMTPAQIAEAQQLARRWKPKKFSH